MTNEELKAQVGELTEKYDDMEAAYLRVLQQVAQLQQEAIERAARMSILMPLRAKHFPAECLTCREGDPCEHKRLLDLSVKPLPPGYGERMLALATITKANMALGLKYRCTANHTFDNCGECLACMANKKLEAALTQEDLKFTGVE